MKILLPHLLKKLLNYKHGEQKNPNARFQALLPNLLDYGLYFESGHSKTFFKSLLKLATSKQEALRNEVFVYLTTCLKKNTGYYADWAELFPQFKSETNNLMAYILTNWEKDAKLSKKLNGNHLKKTVDSIREQNSKFKKSKEVELINSTSEQLAEKVKNFKASKAGDKDDSSEEGSSGGSSTVLFLVTSLLASAAAVYYLSENCCQIDPCKNFVLGNPQFQLNQYLHC